MMDVDVHLSNVLNKKKITQMVFNSFWILTLV